MEPGKLAPAERSRFARAAPLRVFLAVAFGVVDGTALSPAPLHMIGGGASAAAGATLVAVRPLGAPGGAAFFGIYTSALAILGREHDGGAMLVAGASAFSLAHAGGGAIGPALTGAPPGLVPGATFALVALLGAGGAAMIRHRR